MQPFHVKALRRKLRFQARKNQIGASDVSSYFRQGKAIRSVDALGHALTELGFRLCTEDVADLFSMVTVSSDDAPTGGRPGLAGVAGAAGAAATPPEGVRSGGRARVDVLRIVEVMCDDPDIGSSVDAASAGSPLSATSSNLQSEDGLLKGRRAKFSDGALFDASTGLAAVTRGGGGRRGDGESGGMGDRGGEDGGGERAREGKREGEGERKMSSSSSSTASFADVDLPERFRGAATLLREVRLTLKRRRIMDTDFFKYLDADSNDRVTPKEFVEGIGRLLGIIMETSGLQGAFTEKVSVSGVVLSTVHGGEW